jgi:nickel-dependent lactate racemase
VSSSAPHTTSVPLDYSCQELRTGVWQADEPFALHLPTEWRVTTYWPRTPAPLTDSDIASSLDNPVGQQPVGVLCRGKSKPLVIIDDLNRPTPAHRVLPILMSQFRQAGIPPEAVTILIATGTHSPPDARS